MKTVRVVCAHDCPDMCSLLAHVDKGRVVRIEGDPRQPFTAGFACGKVNRDAELVHSPERLTTPLRRTGPKGAGRFAPITWDQALQEINVEYAGKRRSDRLGPIRVNLVPAQFLADLDRRRAERYRRGNEQYKHQYLYTRPGDDAEFPGTSTATASISPPVPPDRPPAGQVR